MGDSKKKMRSISEPRMPYARTSASPPRANTNVIRSLSDTLIKYNYVYYIPIPFEDDSPVENIPIKYPPGRRKRLNKAKSKGKNSPKKVWPYPLRKRCDMVSAKVMSRASSGCSSNKTDSGSSLYKDIDYDPRFDDDLWNVGETNIVSLSRPGYFFLEPNATFNYVSLEGSLLISSSSTTSISSLNNEPCCSRRLSRPRGRIARCSRFTRRHRRKKDKRTDKDDSY